MRLGLLFQTVRHLRLRQLVYQIWYRFYKPKFQLLDRGSLAQLPSLMPFPFKMDSCRGEQFTFISLRGDFTHWQDISKGMLWTYNLNYMDWLLQEDLSYDEGKRWINHFIENLSDNKIGQDPYPTALRIINWIKFICLHREEIPDEVRRSWEVSLWSQVKLLSKRLEFHLLANHLLEDLCALFIASIYFSDETLAKSVSELLRNELHEQLLADGAHYEQSPMYHCILLDRLLDCYNLAFCNMERLGDKEILDSLRDAVVSMLGHLESIVYQDCSIPLVNDSAYDIAPSYQDIVGYATRLGLRWSPIPLADCGYRYLRLHGWEALIDVGNISATYQPGHTHADSLSYELRVNGEPLIIDTGISTYDKTSRREYERSTKAHNTVMIGPHSSSQTWGGFRVGRRARTSVLLDTESKILAQHDGYGQSNLHQREFILDDNGFRVRDDIQHNQATSLLHLAPTVKILSASLTEVKTSSGFVIDIIGAQQVVVKEDHISRRYNQMEPISVLEIVFSEQVEYVIRTNR